MECLNSININGLPLHKLELKEKASVMLFRNIDINSGLCNGTTMKIISITTKIFKVQITNGSHINDYAPRIIKNRIITITFTVENAIFK